VILDDGRPVAVQTERDRIGQGPWSRLFATAAVGDESSSLAERGRALARDGSVHTVEVAEGAITALVEDGGTPCRVTIAAAPMPPRIWTAVSRSARGAPQLEAAVEGRAQSVHLEHVLAVDWEEPLVPTGAALTTECGCDAGGRCAHLVALAYVFADRIDRDPSLLLRWRGCTAREEAPAWLESEPDPEPVVLAVAEDVWRAGTLPEPRRVRPLPPGAVLKRLGPSGIQVGAQDLAEVLERAYASFAASGHPGATASDGTPTRD
jgi:uncharacterized Zn finger protein